MKHNAVLTITSLLRSSSLHFTGWMKSPAELRREEFLASAEWPSSSSGYMERWCSPVGGQATSSCSSGR